MQHVPLAKNAPVDHPRHPLDVPHIMPNKYPPVEDNFVIYPQQHGFSLISEDSERRFKYQIKPTWHDALMFLQQWAFFGLVGKACQLCNLEFSRIEYIDGSMITTEKLQKLSMEWELRRRMISRSEIEQALLGLQGCVNAVSRHIVQAFPESQRAHVYKEFSALHHANLVPLSIALVLEVFEGWVARPFDQGDTVRLTGNVDFPRSQFLNARLETAEWCQREIETIEKFSGGSFSCLLMASSIDRRDLLRAHGPVAGRSGICKCEVIDDRTYKVTHAGRSGCNCPSIDPRIWASRKQIVRDIVGSGYQPIITVKWDSQEGTPQIDIQKSTDEGIQRSYIAISHLWADGLGVRKGQDLPFCQLQRVQKLVNTLVQDKENFPGKINQIPYPFWLDTICVPKTDGESDNLTRKALQSMKDVYKDATAVLVLDATMQSVNLDYEKPEIAMFRIAFSRWISRGWTFEEAGYGKRVFYNFKDHSVEFPHLRKNYFAAKEGRTGIILFPEVHTTGPLSDSATLVELSDPCYKSSITQMQGIWRWWPAGEDLIMKGLRSLLWSLSRRVLTKPIPDEGFILRNLFRSSINFTEIEPKNYVREMFNSFRGSLIPADVLFLDGPRYLEEGNRWIPKSILRPESGTDPSSPDLRKVTNSTAEITADGLVVTLHGIEFKLGRIADNNEVAILFRGLYYYLRFQSPHMQTSWHGLLQKDLVLLLLPEHYGVSYNATLPSPAVLTSILKRTADQTYLYYEAVIHVARAYVPNGTDATALPVVTSKDSGHQGLWCIR